MQQSAAPRRFVAALLAVYLAWGTAVAWLAHSMPPYAGDLTRLAGLSEQDYGWREPQAAWQPPLYTADRFEAGTEVLIVGDSMSLHRPAEHTDPGSYWPNQLAQSTGLRVAALHRREVFIDDLIETPAYRAHPPAVLIFQFAERALLGADRVALRLHGDACQAPVTALTPLPLRQARAIEPQALAPPSVTTRSDFSQGAHALKHRLLRMLPMQREVLEFQLTRDDLFSSRRPDRLLVYWGEIVKLGLTPQRARPFWCSLAQLQQRVEADGRTRFLALMVPDRLTAYQPHVANLPAGYPDLWSGLRAVPGLRAVDALGPIRDALERGKRDVYLPNDTHLGFAGHRLIAEAVLAVLADTSAP